MQRNVGRLTLAVTLIVAGVTVLISNLFDLNAWGYVAKLWPAALVGLGLEWLAAVRVSSPDQTKPRFDGPAVAGLVVFALIAANAPSPFRPQWFHVTRFGPVVSAPAIPSIPVPAWPGTGSISAEHVVTQTPAIPDLQTLIVDGGSADVTVETGEEFLAELKVKAYGHSHDEALAIARQVRLVVESARTARVRWQIPNGHYRINLDLRLVVPRHVQLDLRNSSGDVAVKDREGHVKVRSSSGDIEASDLRGSVAVTATSGTVRVDKVAGDVRAYTSSGSIILDKVEGAVWANAASGDITIEDASGMIEAQTSSGDVKIESKTVGGDYDVLTTSGNVTLSMPRSAGVNLSARATSGTVSGPGWLSLGKDRHSATGTRGDGARKVSVRTSSGSVSIQDH